MLGHPTTDFLDQSAIDSGANLPVDRLNHDAFAVSLLDFAVELPVGSVIAVQGSWGRGKTDVLARAAQLTYGHSRPANVADAALWINPWQYGTPDLLSPLVLALLERIPQEKRAASAVLRRAAESIIRAGVSFGLKGASVALPGGALLGAIADPTDKLLAGLFDAREQTPNDRPDNDPVLRMGRRFEELVDAVVAAKTAQDAQCSRVLICIDDLDRCLPSRQVALLEALNFLVSTGARVVFLVAIDPTLAREAMNAHYRTSAFDTDRYLDKMFGLRITLPSIDRTATKALVAGHLAAVFETENLSKCTCDDFFGLHREQVASWAANAGFPVIEVRNPRVIRRIFNKIAILARIGTRSSDLFVEWDGRTSRGELAAAFLLWLAICERWPALRSSLQAEWSGSRLTGLRDRAEYLKARYTRSRATRRRRPIIAAFEELPDPAEAHGLAQVVAQLEATDYVYFKRWDTILQHAGL